MVIFFPRSISSTPTTTHPEAEGFRQASEPTDAELREARWIDLSRLPASAGAEALAAAVAEVVGRHRHRLRPLGATGRATLRHHVGILMAGILRAAFRGHLVSIQRSPKGGVWKAAVIGRDAAWGILEALERADLVGVRAGVQTNAFGGDDPIFRGLPTRVWPKAALMALAANCNVTVDTLASDWAMNPEAERRAVSVKPDDLVTIHSLERGEGRVAVRPAQAAEAEAMRAGVAELNAHVRAAQITGCPPPAFRRVFRADLRLGGRFYAVGGSSYQNQPKEDRALIRISGEPMAEVDLHAAFLTLLLGLSGVQELPADDLYTAIGLPRAASKAWMVQTFATGTPAARWGRDTPAEATGLGIKASVVRDAALRTYPALGELRRIVPANLLRRLPEDRHGWAVGQYLTNLESRVMDSALAYMAHYEVVGLPMHDSIIVPVGATKVAEDALRAACWRIARIRARVTMSSRTLVSR